MTSKPAQLMNLDAGTLSEGAAADIAIIDTELEWTPSRAEFHSRSHNSPWLGVPLKGRAVTTIVAGFVVYDHGTVFATEE